MHACLGRCLQSGGAEGKLVALFLTVSLAWAVASMVAILVGQFFPHTKGLAYWEFTGGLFGTEPPAWSPAH
jgi:hypothetical protein